MRAVDPTSVLCGFVAALLLECIAFGAELLCLTLENEISILRRNFDWQTNAWTTICHSDSALISLIGYSECLFSQSLSLRTN